jgi:hypothetical protein
MSVPFPTVRNDTAVTPGRWSELVLDPPGPSAARPDWELSRPADRIGRAAAAGIGSVVAGTAVSGGMLLLPGPAWIMRPILMDPGQLLTTSDTGPIDSWTLAANVQMLSYWRAPTDLTGVTAGASLQATADGALQKRPPTGGTYDTELGGDVGALPKPVQGTDTLPMKRIALSNTSFPSNTAFRFQFQLPSVTGLGPASLLTFYFGGLTGGLSGGPGGSGVVTQPIWKLGGQFAIHLYITGEAVLWEYIETGWAQRLNFRWAGGALLSGSVYALDIIPYGRRHLAIFATGAGAPAGPTAGLYPFAWSTLAAPNLAAHYEDSVLATGIAERNPMTGYGPVRVDTRVDFRSRVWVYAMRYPAVIHSVLVDEPFLIPGDTPAGTRLKAEAQTDNLQNSSVTSGGAFDATTGSALPFDTTSQTYGTLATSKQYYHVWRFQASTDQYNSSTLYSERFSLPNEVWSPPQPPVTRGGLIQSVTITGPDIDPTHETAFLEVEDPKAELAGVLSNRARVHFQLTTRFDPSNPDRKSVLVEGEITRASGQRRGKPGYREGANGNGALRQWPSPSWRRYRCTGTGMWVRVADQFLLDRLDFSRDPDAGTDANGHPYRYKITGAIQKLLSLAAFPQDQIDVPDDPLRFDTPVSPEDLILLPSASIAGAIVHFAWDYLGRFLVWDANARKPAAVLGGMWRLLRNPAPPYSNILAEFRTAPAVAGRLATHPNSYGLQWIDAGRVGPAVTFILHDSFNEWVVAPEFNYLVTTGTGVLPGAAGGTRLTKAASNPQSYNPDPAHATATDFTNPDYLGRRVPAIYVDPLLTTEAAVEAVGTRLSGFAGRGQRWFGFTAPLVLVWDATDTLQANPRPARINDIVRVDGRIGILRNCNPHYNKHEGGDLFQWADYEGVYTTQ